MSNANVIFRMMVNKFGTDNLGIQNVYTPVNKIEEATGIKFYDFITPDTKNIAVLFNWEFIYTMLEEASKNNYTNDMQFTYFYDSEADKSALNFNGFDKYRFAKVNYKIDFVNISEFTEQNKNINVIEKAMAGKHFDIVFSNPPYNRNIDLQILQTVFGHTDKVVFIHPAGYLLDKKFKTKIYNDVRNTNYLEKTILVWGNEMFNIGLFMPLTISVWNKEHDSNIVEVIDTAITNSKYTCNVNDISVHGEYFQKVKRFLTNNYDNLLNHIQDQENLTDYSVRFSLIRGNAMEEDGYNDDFFSIIALNNALNKCDHTFRFSEASKMSGQPKPVYSFNNEEERENFLGYCKTKFVRFLMSLTKHGANITRGELSTIPWMDFTQKWNDKKLCEEFNIDEELWNYIDNFIPDYYEDYDDGFAGKAKNIISRHHGVEPNDEMKMLCPAEVIDYLMHMPITCKSGYISKSFSKDGYNYQAYKRNNNDGDDTTFTWCVTRNAKRQNVNK